MFYIVEKESKLLSLENFIRVGCFVHVISSNDLYHPKLSKTVAVYIRMINSKHGFIIPIEHEDGLNVDKKRVYDILNKAQVIYTLNKKDLLYHFNIQKAIDISLAYSMKYFNKLEYKSSIPTIDWYYNKFSENKNINTFIPIAKLYEKCELVYDSIKDFVSNIEIPDGFDFYNKLATNVFFLIEQSGLGIYYEPFNNIFKPRNPLFNTKDNKVFTSYNLYNPTSRPTNNFNSVNFAAIPHTEEHRKTFKPQNDYFVEFDFDGYHLRLLCEQIDYTLTKESAHKQLAKSYFNTTDITEEQYKEAKQINFQAIYGKIPEEHKNLEIFKQIQEYIDAMWSSFNEGSYVYNPQSGKHFTNELKDMHPAKLMNYMMQSLETSNNIIILKEVLEYLKDKKTLIALYTYDAFLFDFSKEDKSEVLENIQKIMEKHGKYPVKFKYSTNLML